MSKFRIKIESNAAEIVRGFKEWPRVMGLAVASAMDLENQATIRHIGQNKLSRRGPSTLGVVSGRLRGSVRATPTRASTFSVTSQIGTNVEYAGVHEHGATIKAKNKPYLRFNVGGRWVQKKSVTIPARRWLSTGIQERESNYSAALSKAIEEAWSR
jgi:phage gpG-like protein